MPLVLISALSPHSCPGEIPIVGNVNENIYFHLRQRSKDTRGITERWIIAISTVQWSSQRPAGVNAIGLGAQKQHTGQGVICELTGPC
ncbi:hypothetical protein GJAV_G00056210 [Gymnothorax javanicus]|nr:hypothetical protein GJAV_G00056210 [Gymnothorax javanicus]